MLGVSLIVVSSAWLVIAGVLVLEVTGLRRRGQPARRQSAGLLLLMSAAVADAFTAQRGWPAARLQAVHLAGLAVAAAGGLIFVRGLCRPARPRRYRGTRAGASSRDGMSGGRYPDEHRSVPQDALRHGLYRRPGPERR